MNIFKKIEKRVYKNQFIQERRERQKRFLMMNSSRDNVQLAYIDKYASIADCGIMTRKEYNSLAVKEAARDKYYELRKKNKRG